MTVKHILEDSKGNQITISVDYCKKTDCVEKVNYVLAQKGHSAVDITEIFIEHMDGDAIIDKLDWSDISRGQGIEASDEYERMQAYQEQ